VTDCGEAMKNRLKKDRIQTKNKRHKSQKTFGYTPNLICIPETLWRIYTSYMSLLDKVLASGLGEIGKL
jgi:hypothetical protein